MSPAEQLLAADAAGRHAAQTRFRGTVVLEAGAGTGKTTTLVARILAWSLAGGWRAAADRLGPDASPGRVAAEVLRGVVAITFTEAGAAEMATRVAEALAHLTSADDAPLPGFDPGLLGLESPAEQAERAHHLLGSLDHLTVETIHAFCRGLLATYPLESGVHPEFAVDPDLRLTEEIVHEVVEEAVRRAYARPRGQPLAELATRGIGPDRLVETLIGLREMGLEARALTADPFSHDGLRAITARLAALVDGFLAAGGRDLRRVTSGNKAVQVAEAIEHTRALVAAAPSDVDGLVLLTEELEGTWRDHFNKLGSWRKGEFTKGESSVLEPHGEAFPSATGALRSLLRHLTRMDPGRLDTARRAVAPLLAECERRAAARGVLTFSDLLARAHELLAGRGVLRRREQLRIQQLLVDEFQDTDPLQSEIVRLLALEGPEHERPGLFLVGDPKQSIFGWRDADLAAYEGFVAAALESGGERFQLVRNFRSDPPLLEEVSAVVRPVMVEAERLQPPFVGLQPDREGSRLESPHWRPVEYWVSWSRHEGAQRGEEAARLEAAAIAADVRALHEDSGVRWSEIALLFRSTNRMDAFLEALRAADVPFIVTRDKHYYRRKEIIDAAALVRAVVDPLDHVALVAHLRSAAVGVPDAALLPLWRRDFPRLASGISSPSSNALAEALEVVGSIAEELPADIPGIERIAGWHFSLAQALENLALLRRSFREDTAADFIDLLRRRSLIEITEAARYQGKFRLANLDRFFRRLEEAMIERGNDMLAILRTLRRSLTEAPDAQEAPPKDSGEDAVQVLTIHKAKGLEFDHVYLPQMSTLHRRDNDLELFDVDRRWRTSREPQYCLLHSATPRWNEVVERGRQVEAMESVRLLYVALTRARQRVVLLGAWPGEIQPRDAAEARSQLDLVHSRDQLAQPAELARRCTEEDRTWLDDGGIRWRFPGWADGEAELSGGTTEPAWLPSAEEVATQADALRARQQAADARMARPRQATASAAAAENLAELSSSIAARDEGNGPGAGAPEPPAPEPEDQGARDRAMLVGTAVHRMFEEWDLDSDPDAELDAARGRARERLAAWLPADEAALAARQADSILDRFEGGALWRRWLEIGPHVVARELPMLSPAGDDGAAIDFLAGAIDLLYRDPADDRWVIVDFKTDRVESEDELRARAGAYGAQEAVYGEAVRQALELETAPRAELWFLWADRLWRSP
jgi:ATP-dependent helicase/nuclease subunit A